MKKLENQAICGASWLHSKQTTHSLEKLKLFEVFYTNMNEELRKGVVEQVKNNRTHLGKLLYTTRDCYIDNMNFNEFITSVIDCAGRDKLEEAIPKAIDIILEKNKSLKKKFSKRDVEKYIKIYMYYQPYIGYAFEQYIRDLIRSKTNYEVITSDYLDKKYAIDMQVVDHENSKVIGLQLKTHSFLDTKLEKRSIYLTKNRSAIMENYCKDVYYVFHDKLCNIISQDFMALTHYKEACTTKDKYIVVDDEEWFIRDLKRVFEKVEKC